MAASGADPARRHEPLEYYGRVGPVGQVFETLAPRLAGAGIAIVGLGMGGLAAYAQPGQQWEFIEIDPDVAAIAADTRYFHFLADAPTPIRGRTRRRAAGVVAGAARKLRVDRDGRVQLRLGAGAL